MPRPARLALIALAAATLFAAAAPAAAHGTGEIDAGGWSFEPLAASLLALSAALYGAGLMRMDRPQRRVIAPRWRIVAYSSAVLILIAALFSPIDALADESFAWHMVQHLLLMFGAGPLLAMANTHLVALMALPLGLRRPVGRRVSRTPGMRQGASHRAAPGVAALVFTVGLWAWHAPRMYDAALADPALHTLEHLTFVVTSAVFWRMVTTAGNRRLDALSALVLVALIGLQGNLLAVLITLSPQPLYRHYAAGGLADQEVAGMLMWIPAGFIYLAASVHSLRSLFQRSLQR